MSDAFFTFKGSAPAASTGEVGDESFVKVRLTKPSELQHYQVSEEQLEMLQGQKRDMLFEAAFLAVGGMIGSAIPAATGLYRAYSPEINQALPAPDLLNVVVFCLSLAVAGACFVMAFTRGRKHSDIIDQIKNPKNGKS